jgi:hypothetical protein
MERRWAATWRTGSFLIAAVWLLAAAPSPAEEPLELVGRPPGRGAVYLLATASLGGTVAHDPLRPGAGAAILFRPQAADHFLRSLYRWNTGLVLQAEYRKVAADRHLLTAEAILRRYTRDMRDNVARDTSFLGIGGGACEGTGPVPGGSASTIWFSLVAEGGYEWSPAPGWILQAKAQYRLFRHHGLDYSGWSFHGGAGVPLPW